MQTMAPNLAKPKKGKTTHIGRCYRDLKVIHININSLQNEVDELNLTLTKRTRHCVYRWAWLKKEQRGFVKLGNYQLKTAFSGQMRKRGGSAIHVKEKLEIENIDVKYLNEEGNIETSAVKIRAWNRSDSHVKTSQWRY